MPIQSKIDRENRLVYTSLSEVISQADFEAHFASVGMDLSLHGFDEIFDLTGADGWSIGNIDFIRIAKKAGSLPAIDKNAHLAVICNTAQSCAILKMYSYVKRMLRVSTRAIHVFRSVAEAEAWLATVRNERKIHSAG